MMRSSKLLFLCALAVLASESNAGENINSVLRQIYGSDQINENGTALPRHFESEGNIKLLLTPLPSVFQSESAVKHYVELLFEVGADIASHDPSNRVTPLDYESTLEQVDTFRESEDDDFSNIISVLIGTRAELEAVAGYYAQSGGRIDGENIRFWTSTLHPICASFLTFAEISSEEIERVNTFVEVVPDYELRACLYRSIFQALGMGGTASHNDLGIFSQRREMIPNSYDWELFSLHMSSNY